MKVNYKKLKIFLVLKVKKPSSTFLILNLGKFLSFDKFLDLAQFLFFDFWDLDNF